MTRTEKNRQESKSSLKAKHKVKSLNSLLFCLLRPIQIFLHRMYCARVEHAAKHFAVKFLSDFARNKITVDVGSVHMLIYNTRV